MPQQDSDSLSFKTLPFIMKNEMDVAYNENNWANSHGIFCGCYSVSSQWGSDNHGREGYNKNLTCSTDKDLNL